jgi:dTDP-glucose 4,6-dehydratase
VITGGAGFLGWHLCERLIADGWELVCLDSPLTGSDENLADLREHERFRFVACDVTGFLRGGEELDWVLRLASPRPRDYLEWPIETLKVGAIGTLRALGLAKATGAGFFLASTSETFGDPQIHPPTRELLGQRQPARTGRRISTRRSDSPRRRAMAYHRKHWIPVRIPGFNTYAPRMRSHDGRAVPTFTQQALRGEQLTVHSDGTPTRSPCCVNGLIEGIRRPILSDHVGPVNIGTQGDHHQGACMHDPGRGQKAYSIVQVERPVDDPELRCPDITLVAASCDGSR